MHYCWQQRLWVQSTRPQLIFHKPPAFFLSTMEVPSPFQLSILQHWLTLVSWASGAHNSLNPIHLRWRFLVLIHYQSLALLIPLTLIPLPLALIHSSKGVSADFQSLMSAVKELHWQAKSWIILGRDCLLTQCSYIILSLCLVPSLATYAGPANVK